MKKSNKLYFIIRELAEGKKVCTKELAQKLGTTLRSVNRYLKEIEEIFQIKLEKEGKGCYYLLAERYLGIIQSREEGFFKLLQLIGVLDPKLLKELGLPSKLIKRVLKEEIIVVEPPLEELSPLQRALFEKIQKSIRYRHFLDIVYTPSNTYIYTKVKPLRLLISRGNWYLAIHSSQLSPQIQFLRLAFIQSVEEVGKQEFRIDKKYIQFLENLPSIFSVYGVSPQKVIVEVKGNIARYFRQKKFLKSQKILETTETGSLILSYQITNPREILYLAKQWFPHFKILTPESLKQEFEALIQQYWE